MLDASFLSGIDLFKHLSDSCLGVLRKIGMYYLRGVGQVSFGMALQKTARGYRSFPKHWAFCPRLAKSNEDSDAKQNSDFGAPEVAS